MGSDDGSKRSTSCCPPPPMITFFYGWNNNLTPVTKQSTHHDTTVCFIVLSCTVSHGSSSKPPDYIGRNLGCNNHFINPSVLSVVLFLGSMNFSEWGDTI